METATNAIDLCARMLAGAIPYPPLHEHPFMQRALLGLLLLAPLCSTIGIQVVNFRLAFFSEAIAHSVFTGVGLGYVFSVWANISGDALMSVVVPLATMAFGIVVASAVTAYRRSTQLSGDTIIGVFSASTVALGLMVISYLINSGQIVAKGMDQTFLAGNILTITSGQIVVLAGFFVLAMALQFFAYNRLILIGINDELAATRGIRVAFYDYLFSALLAVVVMFAIRWVGVLLVTALLVIPAAAARNVSRTAAGLFWFAGLFAIVTSVGGLITSDLLSTTTGATVILFQAVLFAGTAAWSRLRQSE